MYTQSLKYNKTKSLQSHESWKDELWLKLIDDSLKSVEKSGNREKSGWSYHLSPKYFLLVWYDWAILHLGIKSGKTTVKIDVFSFPGFSPL